MSKLHVCIIGAGASGLPSAHHALDAGMDVTIFEQTSKIGGTWVYTDEVGLDKYGLVVHTSRYQGLKTNLPKEVMGYPDYQMPAQNISYLRAEEMLEFLENYTDHFKIRDKIQFEHLVVNVRPFGEKQWKVIVRNLSTDSLETFTFDGIMVCNGHYSDPSIPRYPGYELYRGKILHSHDFRSANDYKGETILIIGSGPSGLDLCIELSKTAKIIVMSQHVKGDKIKFPKSFTLKPDVQCFTENGVKFVDGSSQAFSVIIYCTGYNYKFPFLSAECGIIADNNYVRPLYKHIININRQTMAFIGIPFWAALTQMIDLQIRFFLKFLSGGKAFPSREEMLADTEKEMAERWARGFSIRKAHAMGDDQRQYYFDLATLAEVEPIKPVVIDVMELATVRLMQDFENFRKDSYRILDDEKFEKIN